MSIKHEEMVPLADMVWASFRRDQALIEAENSTFTVSYQDAFKAVIEDVRNLEQSDSMLVTQKVITGQLYLAADGMTKDLKLFQMVLKASQLDTNLVSVLLKNIKTRNIEGALVHIKSLGQVVDDHLVLLTSKGMKAVFPAFLEDKFTELTDLSNQQNQIMKDRKLLTDGNLGTYSVLKGYIATVCSIGKTVFSGTVKGAEYNVSKLLTKLHSMGGGTPPPVA